ncbi:hypothetical protein NL529_33850, partial [Klebsiella pneumoniae]|nr:hypothetical protein [Klebsiella pneumoniae]
LAIGLIVGLYGVFVRDPKGETPEQVQTGGAGSNNVQGRGNQVGGSNLRRVRIKGDVTINQPGLSYEQALALTRQVVADL